MPRTFGWARSVPWCHYAREWAKKTLLLIRLLLGLVRGDPETAAADSRALADIVSRYDLPAFWAGWAAFFQGWAKRSGGAEETRPADMRRGIAIYREQGALVWLSSVEGALAIAEASAGVIDAGLRRLDDALAELERTERWYEVEMHRIRVASGS